ncbi:hypothetical protein MNBD_GAMMA06-225 [hydrothermal vent metagenome]|uniref:Uncharacterized protein n=1 Tax=hydrothermal vent metagenome TaxID=652676 RepID=A0A3B0WI84_9ZZZZ
MMKVIMSKVILKLKCKCIKFITQLFINQPITSVDMMKKKNTRLAIREIFLNQLAEKGGWT